jgi:GGDEF domain-containing protein
MVITDPLTGCYNRRFFDTVIARELKRHSRYEIPLSSSSSTSIASGDQRHVRPRHRRPRACKGEELGRAFTASAAGSGLPPGLGLSVGSALVPSDADVMAVIRTADERMYEEKRGQVPFSKSHPEKGT